MRPGQRIAVSLLITILLFTVFTFLAYSGLFQYIETTIYNSRVSASIQRDLSSKVAVIAEFHRTNVARFRETFSDQIYWQVYRNNESRELIQQLANEDSTLRSERTGYLGYRFIDEDGKIWNSSFPGDVRESGDVRKVYYLFSDVEPGRNAADYIERGEGSFRIESAGQRFAYLLPVENTIGEYQGTLIVYVGYSSLLNTMAGRNVLEAGRSSRLVGEQGYLFNSAIVPDEETLASIGDLLSGDQDSPRQRVIGRDGDRFYNLYSQPAEARGVVAFLAGADELRLTAPLKALLLTLVFLTLFLLSFLLLSLRPDDMAVVNERIKRFQYGFLKEYIRDSDDIDLQRWRTDLENQKEEIKRKHLKGIGRHQREEAARLFDENWRDLITLLHPEERGGGSGSLDISNLEQILEKVLERTRYLDTSLGSGSAGPGGAAPAGKALPEAAAKPPTQASAEP